MSAEVLYAGMYGEMNFGKMNRLGFCGYHLAMVWAMGELDSGGSPLVPHLCELLMFSF